jgi:S-adenosylmethionine:tRNA ribosyltransferase-isomerase
MIATLAGPRSKNVEALDFTLPSALEARVPPEARGLARDEVRMLVSFRDGDRVVDATFRDLPSFLEAGDLLVVNDSATLPAALTATRADGRSFALHLSTRKAEDVWVVEPRETAVAPGEIDRLDAGASVSFIAPYRQSTRLWLARLDLPAPLLDYLDACGRPITYKYLAGQWPIDVYQTVFARQPGSAEMPSAGRPFSPRVLADLDARDVGVAAITLHAGVASLEEHEPPYDEWFEVTEQTARAVNATHARGRRVIAVGTTVVRALESAVGADGRVGVSRGWTDLIVTPDRGVRAVDALLTGFHEPRASHLALLEAVASRPHLENAYAAALGGGYLWHEFGDLHLIL